MERGGNRAVQLVPQIESPKTITYEEYRALPGNGKRYEILAGKLYTPHAPVLEHQRVLVRLARILDEYVRAHTRGEIFVGLFELYLDASNCVEPDLVAVSSARREILQEKNIKGAPDLIVEILSPATPRNDRIHKARLYAKHQVLHYWIVSFGTKTVEAFEWDKGTYRLVGALADAEIFAPTLFPNLKIPLAELWR